MVIWSPTGQQQATFSIDRNDKIHVMDSGGAPVKVRGKGEKLALTITDVPLVVAGLDPDKSFPLEAASARGVRRDQHKR